MTANEKFWDDCLLLEKTKMAEEQTFYFVQYQGRYHIFEEALGCVDRVPGCFDLSEEEAPVALVKVDDDDISMDKIGSAGTDDKEEADIRWTLFKEYVEAVKAGKADQLIFPVWAVWNKKATWKQLGREQRGGARPGAGRKPGISYVEEKVEAKSVSLPPSMWERLEREARAENINRSRYFRRLLEKSWQE